MFCFVCWVFFFKSYIQFFNFCSRLVLEANPGQCGLPAMDENRRLPQKFTTLRIPQVSFLLLRDLLDFYISFRLMSSWDYYMCDKAQGMLCQGIWYLLAWQCFLGTG